MPALAQIRVNHLTELRFGPKPAAMELHPLVGATIDSRDSVFNE